MVTTSEENVKKGFYSVPFDPRFPNCNQTRNCFQNFLDYHRCSNRKRDPEICNYFKNVYLRLCPGVWIKEWEEKIEEGTFPANLN